MALGDYQPERVTVEYKNKALVSVRGLCFDDCAALLRDHMDDLRTLSTMYGDQKEKLLPADIDAMLFSLVTKMPVTAAKMIAIASDEPEGTGAARALPMPLQVKILIEVVRLTFEDVGGPLAFAAMLGQIAGSLPPKLSLNSPAPNGSPTIQ